VGTDSYGQTGYHYRYIYDAQNRRVAKYYVFVADPGGAMLQNRDAKLYCAATGWLRGEGVNPYVGAPVRGGAPVRSSRFSGPVRSIQSGDTILNRQSGIAIVASGEAILKTVTIS